MLADHDGLSTRRRTDGCNDDHGTLLAGWHFTYAMTSATNGITTVRREVYVRGTISETK